MDDNKNKAARKARELSNHLEEEDLWDLEDSWDDDDSPAEQEEETDSPSADNAEEKTVDETAETSSTEEPEEDIQQEELSEETETLDDNEDELPEASETGDLFYELEELEELEDEEPESGSPEDESAEVLDTEDTSDSQDVSETLSEKKTQIEDLDIEDELETIEDLEEPEEQEDLAPEVIASDEEEDTEEAAIIEETEQGEDDVIDAFEDDEEPQYQKIQPATEASAAEELGAEPEDAAETTATAASAGDPDATAPLKRLGLNAVEKVALSAVAISLLGLAIWGYIFLHQRNSIGREGASLELPIKGQHTTISNFQTYWQTPDNNAGVKLGAKVIPFASITLADDASGSGAFRIYFSDADDNSIGDTITLEFSGGKFANGQKTTEISATDGFHEEGDFNAYVLDRHMAWEIQVLEAADASASSSEFTEILKTTVEPIRK
ncbi:hypothetical protein JO972_04365 [Verrucomicrobiaceae bacterium 5K15]|uniref:Uncharacterized protein n=1 Tax=Oceaniferula flava TaxID=2800421 RepID=A0AAE2SA24_9BACT|nr:hypothetical protein [Oceaniferula flavus]MBK1854176.1 hypothetical protein [Oceaniferula flavus]MBM1135482.1 hypothetical protein [Oceaniferula flavus]